MVIPPIKPEPVPIPRSSPRKGAFTLIELLVVIAVMVVAMALIVPAFTGIKGAGDVSKAVYDLSGVLQTARSYATANDTYVWVGFYEENGAQASTSPATAGTGRIVMSIVASKDGTMIYNSGPIITGSMTPNLTQVYKLVKIDNMHLKTAVEGDPVFPMGNNGQSGTPFDQRPAATTSGTTQWQIGDSTDSGSSQGCFQYPTGKPAPSAQYQFTTAIQFSPRGEARLVVSNQAQPLQSVLEIGLQPTHGSVVATTNQNVAAVQISGIAGNVEIFRK